MQINYDANGLVPAIIQDSITNKVLMLGYMNEESLGLTQSTRWVTFFSRSRNEIWVKGETSGNKLQLVDIQSDCDQDTLLVKAKPMGPVCHTGSDTCWNEKNPLDMISYLEQTIDKRRTDNDDNSYVSSLFRKGINKIAQKVGEEAVEIVIEAKDDNEELFLNEAADLFFHYLILLQAKGFKFSDVESILRERVK